MVNAPLASCSELSLNLEVVVSNSAEGYKVPSLPQSILAFAERLYERQRNLLLVWPCRRLRVVRRCAKDRLEESLARACAVDRKGQRHYMGSAAFVVCVRWPMHRSVLYGQSQEDQAARATPVAGLAHHEDPGQVHRLRLRAQEQVHLSLDCRVTLKAVGGARS